MSKERRNNSKEFKLEAIQLYENGERSVSEVERELGITKGLLWKWRASLAKSPKEEETFPGNGRMADPEARIRQLERENHQLRQDKEILKKVLEMFSKDGK